MSSYMTVTFQELCDALLNSEPKGRNRRLTKSQPCSEGLIQIRGREEFILTTVRVKPDDFVLQVTHSLTHPQDAGILWTCEKAIRSQPTGARSAKSRLLFSKVKTNSSDSPGRAGRRWKRR